MEGRERELRLGLDSARRENGHAVGAVARVGEKHTLADARLPTDREHATCARLGVGEQAVDPAALVGAPKKRGMLPPRSHRDWRS